MKKLMNAFYAFWLFKVKNRRRAVVESGGFNVSFREYDMTVKSLSKNFSLNLRADTHPFGYLSVSHKQGNDDNVHGYAMVMYLLATNITKDEKLYKEVHRALMRFNDRQEAIAKMSVEKEDKNDAEIAHNANIAAERADMETAHFTRAQRRAKEREMRKIARKELSGKDE